MKASHRHEAPLTGPPRERAAEDDNEARCNDADSYASPKPKDEIPLTAHEGRLRRVEREAAPMGIARLAAHGPPIRERLDMKLASCDNCAHRQESSCALGMAPAAGEFLCPRYAMNDLFREELLALARREFERDVNQAMLHISVMRAEKSQAFAG